MNYIYDITTNFNNKFYDFFEWNKNDKLINFQKIPIIRVNKYHYNILFTNIFKISKKQLNQLKNKSKILNKQNKNIYLLITNGKDIFGIMFNKNGKSIKRSSLNIEDELDMIKTCKKIKIKKFSYQILRNINIPLTTRNYLNKLIFINKKLNKISSQKDKELITYLYYECYNKLENNQSLALNKLKNQINNANNFEIMYNFFK